MRLSEKFFLLGRLWGFRWFLWVWRVGDGGGGHLLVFLCYGRWCCTGLLRIWMRGTPSFVNITPCQPACCQGHCLPLCGHVYILACVHVRAHMCHSTTVETGGQPCVSDCRLLPCLRDGFLFAAENTSCSQAPEESPALASCKSIF